MARTLPWTVDHLPPAKKARVIPAPRIKRERASSPTRSERSADNVADLDSPSKATASTTGRSRRTPSSSPIRGPPTTELMREGYDGDDIYIMVEDEFQTVAQAYTAHLHHAEYKRLVKQAREAAPKALPEPTSRMAEKTKRRLRSAALHNKQKETLRRVAGNSTLEDDEDEDKITDLWSGTSLAPLMARSGQQKMSLVGLEGISSTTKAGMGLARSQSHRKNIRDAEEDGHDQVNIAQNSSLKRDNVDRLSTSRVIGNKASLHNGLRSTWTSRASNSSVLDRRQSPVHSRPEERPKKHRFVVDLDDSCPAATVSGSQNDGRKSRATPQSAGKPLSKGMTDKVKDKKSRLEEVPMFII
ncbi:uncharacterized protein Z519_01422 [Cladophialophora bantiana CBS 173.52]|uniref:Uncharacterized protein n=1 Tax=Cladophialophora bantiana (strain ATCC 10958 / CBS 173.52 / CDC B-1940 / NIH 8579) TaxID=1442370 RepID=A0A0D2HWT6_CLAB1|nr:uncharacterized protein Z519_01422 [Cladophialophora bantiana CBS 173.52]KIW97838.1 hypothetical protein Z519_01422 [Cladophialophora bantiana CBS 173.52]